MTNNDLHRPIDSSVQALLDRIAPGSRLTGISCMPGSYSNFTHAVTYQSPTGAMEQVVLRRFNPQNGKMAFKARLEFTVYTWLHNKGIPVPRPIYLDDASELLDLPGFIVSLVPGRQVMWPDNPPDDPICWARKSAEMLACIHAVPIQPVPDFLPDNNTEVLYFRWKGSIPKVMRADPDGLTVWEAVERCLPTFERAPAVLVHSDYWAGNILWDGGEISAVLDWEEAGYGDPGVDVAYALMELHLVGEPEAADEFLRVYEARSGCPVANLHFWSLAAAVRPMEQPEGWISDEPFQGRYREFVRRALAGIK
jgi:aminoglycoside phosphotransferase (APT) family kinase protein